MVPSVERLREIGLFGGLEDHVLESFCATLPVLEQKPGDMIFKEGESGREMFVLLDGEMEVFKRSRKNHEARVAVLGPGDWFGEMAILDIMPRSATVRALAVSHLLRLSTTDLDALYRRDVKSYSLLVLNIAREMSRRLRVADAVLADMASHIEEYTRPRMS